MDNIKRKCGPGETLVRIFFVNLVDYSPATIAPIGQASAQVPQSVQAFGSIT